MMQLTPQRDLSRMLGLQGSSPVRRPSIDFGASEAPQYSATNWCIDGKTRDGTPCVAGMSIVSTIKPVELVSASAPSSLLEQAGIPSSGSVVLDQQRVNELRANVARTPYMQPGGGVAYDRATGQPVTQQQINQRVQQLNARPPPPPAAPPTSSPFPWLPVIGIVLTVGAVGAVMFARS